MYNIECQDSVNDSGQSCVTSDLSAFVDSIYSRRWQPAEEFWNERFMTEM